MVSITFSAYVLSIPLLISQGSAGYLPNNNAIPDCSTNQTYTVVSGDTCSRIARAHGVPRGSLVFFNDVRSDCADLRVGQILCLPQPCELYPVNLGTTCLDIVEDNDITIDELFEWNEYLNSECTNLLAGDEVCIAEPSTFPTPTTTASTTAIRTSGYSTETVPPPGPVPRGTTSKCGEYYQVKSGDYCDSIADRYGIDLELFQEINPAINAECTNLVPGLYYCVSPTEDWNQTTTTTVTSTYTAAPAPTTSGSTSHCYEWYVARAGDTCDRIASIYGISVQDFRLLNPSLKEDCSNLRSGLAYCIHGEPEDQPSPAWVFAAPTAESAI
ncbi:hypothetical protein BDW62DRAFT_106230 [Aspergillus aurantiobrunneus]